MCVWHGNGYCKGQSRANKGLMGEHGSVTTAVSKLNRSLVPLSRDVIQWPEKDVASPAR